MTAHAIRHVCTSPVRCRRTRLLRTHRVPLTTACPPDRPPVAPRPSAHRAVPYARPAIPYVPRPPVRPERPCTRSTHRVRPTVRARHLPNTQMFSAHNMLIINKHKRNIHLKTAKYIHFAAENPQPLPSFLPPPISPLNQSENNDNRRTLLIEIVAEHLSYKKNNPPFFAKK